MPLNDAPFIAREDRIAVINATKECFSTRQQQEITASVLLICTPSKKTAYRQCKFTFSPVDDNICSCSMQEITQDELWWRLFGELLQPKAVVMEILRDNSDVDIMWASSAIRRDAHYPSLPARLGEDIARDEDQVASLITQLRSMCIVGGENIAQFTGEVCKGHCKFIQHN